MASKTGKSLEVVMWLVKIWAWTISLLLSTRGEAEGVAGVADNAAGTGDNADNSESTGEGEGQEGSAQEGAEGDTGGEESEADNVAEEVLKLFGGDKELAKQFKGDPSLVVKSYKELMGKSKPTEMENAKIKNWANKYGLKPVYDNEGQISGFAPGETKQALERQRKFTDEHSKNFAKYFSDETAGKGFLDLISLHIQDLLDDGIANREKIAYQAMEFKQKEQQSWNKAKQVWPSVDPDTEGFPEDGSEHFKLAQKLYNENDDYQRHPKGMFFAVAEAAARLQIAPSKVAAAKREGFQQGLQNKKILKKVGGGSGSGTGTGSLKQGELSMEEFIALSPSKRVEYQQRVLKQK